MNLAAGICWFIWKARNHLEFKAKKEEPQETIRKINQWWNSVQMNIQETDSQNNREQNSQAVHLEARWQAPTKLSWKVNCDASFQAKQSQGQIAFVCRDNKGTIIHLKSSNVFSHSALQAEMTSYSRCYPVCQAISSDLNSNRVRFLQATQICKQTDKSHPWEAAALAKEITEKCLVKLPLSASPISPEMLTK